MAESLKTGTPHEVGLTRGSTGEETTASLLVPNRVSLADADRAECPRMRGFVFVSDATGAIVPASCQTNGCVVCGPRRAMATAFAVNDAGCERRVTLTMVGDSASEVRKRLSRFRYRLRQDGYRWEEWGAIERNPQGTGFHYHGWQRGDYVPTRAVSAAADREGMGRVADMRAHRAIGGHGGALYGAKVVAAYGVKGASAENLHEWLHLNGGRHGIWSRGFFGMPYREALRAALGRAERDGHDPGPWRLHGTAGGIVTAKRGSAGIVVD